MARALQVDLEGLSTLSLDAKNPAVISSQCSVFAESEVVTLVNEGRELPDISAGNIMRRPPQSSPMARKVGLVEDVALTGGCAKNVGLAKALEDKLGVKVIKRPQVPADCGGAGEQHS